MKRLLRALRVLKDRRQLRRSPLFDGAWYLDSYPDLQGRIDPAWHYLAHGATEGRDPGPMFSTSGYRLQTDPGHANPLLHYETLPKTARPAALPSFVGTAKADPTAGCVLFFAHQALGQQFGAERSLLHMLDHAGQAGLAAEVVVPQCLDPAYLSALRARVRRVHILPCPWRRQGRTPHPATIATMVALIRSCGAREIHQNTLVLDAPLIAARAAGVTSVVYLRELPDQDAELCARLNQSPQQLRADLLSGADRFIANSDATARWIDPEGCLPENRLVVLPNAVDPALTQLPFAPHNPVRIGLIGSNIAKKGIADMVKVAQISAQAGLPAHFLLVGPATPDLAALGPLPVNLRHAGYAETPVAALEQIDILLCLSHFAESFGRTVLEAMAAGRPVIAYDRGTPPALIGTEGAGRVVSADDPQAVVAALTPLLHDPANLATASRAARLRANALIAHTKAVPAAQIYAQTFGKHPANDVNS